MSTAVVVLVVILVIVLVLVLIGAGVGISSYNSLVRLRNKVQEAWRQIDVELNRRYDLIPNLVETVKGYARHESETLEKVIEMRNQARALASQDSTGVPSQARADTESQLTGVVRQIMVTAEAYPQLKADAGFRQLSSQLAQTEDRIANGRRYYNAVVGDYNTKVEAFPSNLIANMGGFKKAGYFEVESEQVRQAPRVSFDDAPQDRAITDGSTSGNQPVWDVAEDQQTRVGQPGYAPQPYGQQDLQQGFNQPPANPR